MSINEFKAKLREIENCIKTIADIEKSIIDDMIKHGHDAPAEDFKNDVCDWFPVPFSTDYVPLTFENMVDEYGDLFAAD